MKKLLTVFLSILITITLIMLGASISAKKIITKTITTVVKDEITNKIIEASESSTNLNKEELKEKVNKVLNENPKINTFVNSSFDKLIDVLNDDISINEINFENEVNELIEEATPLLNEYGITLTEEMKNEIISYVKTDEANNLINETINEIKTNIPENMNVMLTVFTNLVSMKFKIFLISLILIFLLLIAFIKKSCYKWTINLSIPSIITGIFFSISSYITSTLIKFEEISFDLSSLTSYGVVNLILGITLLIIYIVINKKTSKKITE